MFPQLPNAKKYPDKTSPKSGQLATIPYKLKIGTWAGFLPLTGSLFRCFGAVLIVWDYIGIRKAPSFGVIVKVFAFGP